MSKDIAKHEKSVQSKDPLMSQDFPSFPLCKNEEFLDGCLEEANEIFAPWSVISSTSG